MGSQPLDPKFLDLISTPEGRRHLAYHMISPVKIDPQYETVDGVTMLRFDGKLFATHTEVMEYVRKRDTPPPCPICHPPEKP